MHIEAKLPRGTASDSLMTQIHIDNVLQTHAILAQQAAAIQIALTNAVALRSIPRCGEDPVSKDAQKMFQAKIDLILDSHEDYLVELREACERLRQAAVQYGLIEDDVTDSLR
ncbi:hypothetical protein [Pseudonocardia sp. NPDC049635]|uniref:hypothetical protein n=1 Tax=Pseudonocardia sp. NPDC049635 TaxID=3155506 RepID=UPI0033D8DA9D